MEHRHLDLALEDATGSYDVNHSQDVDRPAKRSRTRNFVSKFKTFDDGFDMDSIPAYTLQEGEESAEPSQVYTHRCHSFRLTDRRDRELYLNLPPISNR